MVKGGPHEEFLSECCSAPYFSVSADDEGMPGTIHAECTLCGKTCDLKARTAEIGVSDGIGIKDTPV